MDEPTISYYDRNPSRIIEGYESADMTEMHGILRRHIREGGDILEIGCGSGRDAAFLVSEGCNVTAIDASRGMIDAAVEKHPELKNRTRCASLPLPHGDPLLRRRFGSICSIATFMHIPDRLLFECVAQIRDMLQPGGVLIISSSIGREDICDDRDRNGRLYIERPSQEYQLLFERLGFRFVTRYETEDSFGRGFNWYTLVLEKSDGGISKAVDEIETIISHDKKNTTYKIALLRSLCDIAQSDSRLVKWRPDGAVSVPLGLIVEKWLFYYWPLIEQDQPGGPVAIPQQSGQERHSKIGFRSSMQELIHFYRHHGGISSMYQDYKSGLVPEAGKPFVNMAIRTIAQAILAGPIKYSGGAIEREREYFQEDKQSIKRRRYKDCFSSRSSVDYLGEVIVPGGAWREMCLIGHWISESLVLRWAELTRRFSNYEVPVEQVVGLLLTSPVTERDVRFARSVYQELPDLSCVWTGQRLRRRFAVDHAIPFSIWQGNDLWNLLPAADRVNSQKSDKLVSSRTLLSSRDRIVHYWDILKDRSEERFVLELGRSLLRGPYTDHHWKTDAFIGLFENIEVLAAHRGLQRWEAGT